MNEKIKVLQNENQQLKINIKMPENGNNEIVELQKIVKLSENEISNWKQKFENMRKKYEDLSVKKIDLENKLY
jgi:ferredoxin-fold anticodon binding domain-containing protein